MKPLTFEMIMVISIIGIAVFLFIVEWVRVDVVAILVMVGLPLLGLVSPKEAFMGLSSNAVVSIIAVIIIGAGLDKTGVVNRMVAPLLRIAGNSPSRIIIAICLAIATISSFMQNVGAAALFLPAVQRVSRSLKIPISRLLMPIGFCAILGGTVTLVGSSPLILLNDLLTPFKLQPFGLFDVTPIGLALVGSGIAIFIFFGRLILPQGEAEPGESAPSSSPENISPLIGGTFELHTPKDFTHYRDPVTVAELRKRYLVNVVAMVAPPDFKIMSPEPELEIHSDIDIVVCGKEKDVVRMAEQEGMTLKAELEVFKNELSQQLSGTVEAVVPPRSPLAGKSILETDIHRRFGVTILAVYREGEVYRSELDEMPLKVGDALLLHGLWKRIQGLQKDRNLLLTTPIDVEIMRPEKAIMATIWLAISLVMILVFKVQLSVCLMTGAIGMVITKVLSIDEAYQSVDWRTIFLLGGLIPLGVATEKTGTAAWIAHTVLGAIGTVPPIVLLSVIGILATVFTLVISNVGATVLLVPLVINMAMAANADPRMAALVVGLATSNSFILPTHQVNALYMGPGHYRSIDFIKAGTVVSVNFLVVMIAAIYFIYGV
jgi:di/tricarboxylate transporter